MFWYLLGHNARDIKTSAIPIFIPIHLITMKIECGWLIYCVHLYQPGTIGYMVDKSSTRNSYFFTSPVFEKKCIKWVCCSLWCTVLLWAMSSGIWCNWMLYRTGREVCRNLNEGMESLSNMRHPRKYIQWSKWKSMTKAMIQINSSHYNNLIKQVNLAIKL